MASAMDSGFDTGNDSNDSLAQEKHALALIDFGCIKPKQRSLESEKENSSEEEQDKPQSSSNTIEKSPEPGMSLTHIQPASLMHGYEYTHSSQCKPHCLFPIPTTIGVFVSGGPFGTEFQQDKLVSKMKAKWDGREVCQQKIRKRHRTNNNLAISNLNTCPANYAQFKDTMRMCRFACHNNTQGMREMLEAGISPNRYDKYKRTPLHMAACMGYADMVKLLLEHGADPNAKDSIGNTALHLAACTNHVNVVTLLLRGGTRVAERDKSGHSPLQLAITKFNIMKRSIMPHPVLKEQVCQVISMLTEYMRHKEGSSLDPDILTKFESLVRVSDSTEQVESNIRDLLSNLSSLSLSNPS